MWIYIIVRERERESPKRKGFDDNNTIFNAFPTDRDFKEHTIT